LEKLEKLYTEGGRDVIHHNIESEDVKNSNKVFFQREVSERQVIDMLRLNIHVLINKLRFNDRAELLSGLNGWLSDQEMIIPEDSLPFFYDLPSGIFVFSSV
jgi:hypothetical protein